MHGLLNVNKPAGMTSRELVDQVQWIVAPAKVGHAGTLDPLATGVLVVCVGSATRLVEYIQRLPKRYQASFLLGRRSDTDDSEGRVTPLPAARIPSRAELEALLPRFEGTILQRPPDYSAVKVGGKRAYQLARQGKPVPLTERPVSVHSLRVTRYEYPELELAVECGSGVYIRSLGRDLAEALGTGAIMNRLTRTAIGPFRIEDAIELEMITLPNLTTAMLPLTAAVSQLPTVALTADEIETIRHGRPVLRPGHIQADEFAALDAAGNLLAILAQLDADRLTPTKVLSE